MVAISFGTSQRSTFFCTNRLQNCPNIGTGHRGASMRSRTMSWSACFTIPRARHGSVELVRPARSCLKDLQKTRLYRLTGSHPDSKGRFAETFGDTCLRHSEHLRFQSGPSFMELP